MLDTNLKDLSRDAVGLARKLNQQTESDLGKSPYTANEAV
jgi:hypothetical protein